MERDEVNKKYYNSARVIQVIETHSPIGEGSASDPVRPIYRYWDFNGNLLAINDFGLEFKGHVDEDIAKDIIEDIVEDVVEDKLYAVSARVIQVIETRSPIDVGSFEDQTGLIYRYWDFNGKLLAVSDGEDDY